MHHKFIAMDEFIPLPSVGHFRSDTPPQVIGMHHVPSNTILAGPDNWRQYLGLPTPTQGDYRCLDTLSSIYNRMLQARTFSSFYQSEFAGIIALSESLEEIEAEIKLFSFIKWLEDRGYHEVETYLKNGVGIIQLENVGPPYFVRNDVPVADQFLMNHMAAFLRREFPDLPLGIQILSFADNIALEIALRNRFFYVRAESFLFHGIRPEGQNPNQGNLAKAYLMREYFSARLSRTGSVPRFYADILKKHTFFPTPLQRLGPWLDSVEFSKLEGVILTGHTTGQAVDASHLLQAKHYITQLKERTGGHISLPLIAGSGANPSNVAVYKSLVNAIIIGSYVKKEGYWQLPLDEDRLKQFMDAFAYSP